MNKYYIASVVVLACFIMLAFFVSPKAANNTQIIEKDAQAFINVNNSHVSFLNKIMIYLTEYGREAFWIGTMMVLFILGGWSGRKTVIVMILAMIVIIPIGYVAKDVIQRPRPVIPDADILIPSDNDYSFPSGHATIVAAGAAVSLSLFRDSNRKLAISLALAFEAALVCISRVYVGGHYPLDVVGGILLGSGISFIFIGSTKQIENMLKPLSKILKR